MYCTKKDNTYSIFQITILEYICVCVYRYVLQYRKNSKRQLSLIC